MYYFIDSGHAVKVSDIVRIKGNGVPVDDFDVWPESHGQIGMVVAMAKRLHVPAAKVMVLGEIAEFDIDELEIVE